MSAKSPHPSKFFIFVFLYKLSWIATRSFELNLLNRDSVFQLAIWIASCSSDFSSIPFKSNSTLLEIQCEEWTHAYLRTWLDLVRPHYIVNPKNLITDAWQSGRFEENIFEISGKCRNICRWTDLLSINGQFKWKKDWNNEQKTHFLNFTSNSYYWAVEMTLKSVWNIQDQFLS